MKRLTRTLALTALTTMLATPALAAPQDDNGHQNDAKQVQSQGSMKMQDQMKEMQNLMDQIKQENDPAKRQQLMQKHMSLMQESMQESMQMMHGNMEGCMGKMKDHQMESKESSGMGSM